MCRCSAAHRGGIIKLPLDQPPTAENIERLRKMGARGETVWVVTVTNTGRTATNVSEVGADLIGAAKFTLTDMTGNGRPLPHRLEPHSSETWTLPLREVLDALEATDGVLRPQGLRSYAVTPAATRFSKDSLR